MPMCMCVNTYGVCTHILTPQLNFNCSEKRKPMT